MGNCWSLQSGSASGIPNSNNQSGSIQFSFGFSNAKLIQNGNSTSLGRSSHSGGTSRLFSNKFLTGNNTSSSLWGSENSQASGLRDEEEFPNGQILDAANLSVFTKNFRPDSVLGKGGFGTAFQGLIKDTAASSRGKELTIAIKKLNYESNQGIAEWQVLASLH